MVSSAAQFGSDRADIADSMGHTAAEMAGRAGMYGMSSTMHGVGWTAGKARRIMNRGKRALRSGKGMRKTAGKPKALSEAKPSEKIGKFAAKGKASKRIGKHIGAGLGNAGRSVKRMGSTGMGWMDEAGNPASPDTLKTPQQGAATQLWAATSPLLAGMGGPYCEDCDIAGIAPDDSRTLAGVREHAIDPEQARRLWRLSATLTGIDAFAS